MHERGENMKYPMRCVIVDIAGKLIDEFNLNIVAATPEISKPHVGKHGLAERIDDWTVKITLDDGNIIYGYECWWMPEDEWEEAEKLKMDNK